MKKFYSILFLIVAGVTAIFGGVFANLNKSITANAFVEVGSESNPPNIDNAVQVGEIWDNENKTFNQSNLNRLFRLLTGDAGVSTTNFTRVKNAALGEKSAFQIRSTSVLDKTSGKDIIVTMGNQLWTPVYMCGDADENPILTLWMYASGRSTQWSTSYFYDRSRTSGEPGGIDAYSYSGSNGNYSYLTYGTSALRSGALNGNRVAGGSYAMFTVPKEGDDLTDYLVTPAKIGWQQTGQNAGARNENWGSEGGWENDFLWLPSYTEVGETGERAGLWETSTAQRSNEKETWLRSARKSTYAYYAYTDQAYYIFPDGTRTNHNTITSNSFNEYALRAGVPTKNYAIRPAVHLNLDLARQNSTLVAGTLEDCTVDTIPNGIWNPVTNVAPNVTVRNAYSSVVLIQNVDYTVSMPNITAPGTYTITINGTGDYSGSKTATYVVGNRDINVALRGNETTIPTQFYTGSKITPAFSDLKDYCYQSLYGGSALDSVGRALVQNVHYTLSYGENIETGTGSVTISGMGNYSGSTTVLFTISEPSITGSNFTLANASTEYNFGEDLISKISPVIVAGGKTLTLNTHYTIAVYDSTGATLKTTITEVGRYVVRATGKGSYVGTAETNFDVTRCTVQSSWIAVTGAAPTYSGTAKTVSLTVIAMPTINGVTTTRPLVKDQDYTVSYDSNTNASTSARAIVTGQGNFTGVAVRNFTISPKSIGDPTVTISNIPSQQYTGSAIAPTFTLTDTAIGTTLALGTDYSVSYTNNVDVSTATAMATITIAGIGNYGSTTTKTFQISARLISNADLSAVLDQAFTGAEVTPDVTVIDNGTILQKNVDYTLSYTNNIQVGQATVTVNGTGNYTGTKSTVFYIVKASLANAGSAIETSPLGSAPYTGRPISLTISVTTMVDSNKVYVAAANYEISVTKDGVTLSGGLTDIVNVGTYTIIATGKDNFDGSVRTTFVVTRCNISTIAGELNQTSFVYNGSVQTPTETLVLNGSALVKGTDYDVEYRKANINGLTVASPTDAETYFLIISGKGNFDGNNTTLSYTINPINLNSCVTVFTSTGSDTITESAFSTLNYTFDNTTHKVEVKSVKVNGIEFYTGANACLDVIYLRGDTYTTEYKSAGTITIKIASLGNNVEGQKTYSYSIARRTLENNMAITITGLTNATYNKTSHNNHTITIIDSGAQNYTLNANDYSIIYPADCTSANPSVNVRFVATTTGNYTGETSRTFKINPAVVDSFSISSEEGTYNANRHTISATVLAGSLTLDTTEYRLVYSRAGGGVTDNITDVGTITVTLEVTSANYSTATSTIRPLLYTINPIEITGATLSTTTLVYDTAAHELAIASVVANNVTILPVTDYQVKWRNVTTGNDVTINADGKFYATDAAEYRLTVTPKMNSIGSYNVTGSAEATFTINAREITFSVINYYQTEIVGSEENFVESNGHYVPVDLETNYRGQRVRPIVEMVLNGATYTLQMSTFDAGTINPTGDYIFAVYLASDTSCSNNILLSSTANYISVGEYKFVITGNKNFSGKIEKIYRVNLAEFNQQDIDITIYNTDSIIYTGNPITFHFNTKEGDVVTSYNEIKVEHVDEKQTPQEKRMELFLNKDFVLFSGYIQVTYNTLNNNEITAAAIYDSTIASGYTQAELDARNILRINGGYVNNNSVGQAAVVIASKENSAFTINSVVIKRFQIRKLVLTEENTTVGTASGGYTYNGEEIFNPANIILIKDGRTRLYYNTDYTFTYKRNGSVTNDITSAGQLEIFVQGINTYEGSFSKFVTISPKALETSMFVVSEDKVYNGTLQKPTITGTFNSGAMTVDIDYGVSYSSSSGETPDFIRADVISVEITGMNNFTGTITKTYTIEKQVIKEIVLAQSRVTFNGADQTYVATVKDVANQTVLSSEYTLINSTTDLKSAGTIRVSVSVDTSSNYRITTEVYAEFVIEKASLASIRPEDAIVKDIMYTGYVIRPELTDITLKLGSYTLTIDEYAVENVSNSLNVSTSESKALVVLKATGKNFDGKLELNFNVVRRPLDTVTIANHVDELIYNAKSQVPTFNLSYLSMRLMEGNDFSVSVSRRNGINDEENYGLAGDEMYHINTGEFDVTIVGEGNYTGSVSKQYKIVPRSLTGANVSITFVETSFAYTGFQIIPTIDKLEVLVDSTRVGLTESDCTKTYRDNINAGNATITITGLATSSNPYSGNFINSIDKTFLINQRELKQSDVIIEGRGYNNLPEYYNKIVKEYTGQKIYLNQKTQDVFVYIKNEDNSKGSEVSTDNYDINYPVTPQNKGTYTFTIKGKANYKGSVQATIEVVSISLSDARITFEIQTEGGGSEISDMYTPVYTGANISNDLIRCIKVKIGEVELKYNSEYTIVYEDASRTNPRYLIDVGQKIATITPRTGNNNVTDSCPLTFQIIQRDLESCDFTLNKESYVYTGSRIVPDYTLSYNGIELRNVLDYELVLDNEIDATGDYGYATGTIYGDTGETRNFKGSITFDFRIEQATPVIDFEIPDKMFFVGDTISVSDFGLTATYGEKNLGTGFLLKNTTQKLVLGDNTIRYDFTPNDARNFKKIENAVLRINAVYYVKVEFKYNNRSDLSNVIAASNARIDVTVSVRTANGDFSKLTEGEHYIRRNTLVESGEEVSNFEKAGRYCVEIEMTNPTDYSIQTDASVEFYAKSKTIYASNAPFYAVGRNYFEEGVELVVDVYEAKRDIVSIIGTSNYDSIKGIGKVYIVRGLFKGNTQQSLSGVSIYYEPLTNELYMFSDDELSSPYRDSSSIQVDPGVFIIEATRQGNLTMIIIIAAAAAIVLIIAIIIIVKVMGNRKYKLAAANARVNMQQLNQVANGGMMNQGMMNNQYGMNQQGMSQQGMGQQNMMGQFGAYPNQQGMGQGMPQQGMGVNQARPTPIGQQSIIPPPQQSIQTARPSNPPQQGMRPQQPGTPQPPHPPQNGNPPPHN